MGAESSTMSCRLTFVSSGVNTGSGLGCFVFLVVVCHWLKGGAGPEVATAAKVGGAAALGALGAFGTLGVGGGGGWSCC